MHSVAMMSRSDARGALDGQCLARHCLAYGKGDQAARRIASGVAVSKSCNLTQVSLLSARATALSLLSMFLDAVLPT